MSPLKTCEKTIHQISNIKIPCFSSQNSKFVELDSPDKFQTQIRTQMQNQLSPKILSSESEYSENDDAMYDSYQMEQLEIEKNIAKYY